MNAALTSLVLSETYAGSRWLHDLGWLAFTLDQVRISRPTKPPRGRALTRAQKAVTRRIARRRVRIEPGNSRVQRGRMVHDTRRRRKVGVRDRSMEVCGVLQNFRVRLTPW
jgi:hypothetical protein